MCCSDVVELYCFCYIFFYAQFEISLQWTNGVSYLLWDVVIAREMKLSETCVEILILYIHFIMTGPCWNSRKPMNEKCVLSDKFMQIIALTSILVMIFHLIYETNVWSPSIYFFFHFSEIPENIVDKVISVFCNTCRYKSESY